MTCHHARQPPPSGSAEEYRTQLRATVQMLSRSLLAAEPNGWRLAPETAALVQEYIEGLEDVVTGGALVPPRLTVAHTQRLEPAREGSSGS